MKADQFLDTLAKTKVNQANYQPVVLCHLLSADGLKDTQENIAHKLKEKNPSGDFAYFKSASCPVWKVLSGKKMIKKAGDFWQINADLSKSEIQEARKICMGLMA